jgi:hypothetical protein
MIAARVTISGVKSLPNALAIFLAQFRAKLDQTRVKFK